MRTLLRRFSAFALSAFITAGNIAPACFHLETSADESGISKIQNVTEVSESLPAVIKMKISSESSLLRFLSGGIFGKEKFSVTVYAKDSTGVPISDIKLFSHGIELENDSAPVYASESDSYYMTWNLEKGEYNLSAAAYTYDNQVTGGFYAIDLSKSNNDEVNEKEYPVITATAEDGSLVLVEDVKPEVTVKPVHVDLNGNYTALDSMEKYTDGAFRSFYDSQKVWTSSGCDYLVTASDGGSGVYSISYKLNNLPEYTTQKADSSSIQAQFSLIANGGDSTGEKFLSAKAEDNSGNISDTVNSVPVETDNIPPSITIEKAEVIAENGTFISNYTENKWVNKRVRLTVSADDSGSGADRIEISAPSNKVSLNNVSRNGKKLTYIYIIEPDFMGNVSFTAFDRLENRSREISYKIMAESTSPSITSFDISQDINYTEISVEAYDIEPYCSGIDYIEIGFADSQAYNESDVKIIDTQHFTGGDSTQMCSFSVDSDFRGGQILARAADCAGNTGKWRTLDSLITDSQEIHNDSSYMGIIVPEASYTDAENNPLYDTDQTITLDVKDSHAGISEIKWYVRTSEGIIAGSDSVSSFTKDNTDGWAVVRKRDVITEASKEINISADENNIEIGMCFSDNAGFETPWQIKYISIDKTAPEIVSFAFDDKSDKKIFNTNRTASIIVRERNLNTSKELIDITVSDMLNKKAVPYTISNWEHISTEKNSASDGENFYKITINFTADAEYKINFTAQDITGKKSEAVKPAEFVIDRTSPDIKIVYDNNDSVNKNYYNADRTATITITEHNFDSKGVEYTLEAFSADNVTKMKMSDIIPSELKWVQDSKNKDKWTAVVNFNKEGRFSFTVSASDKAGNKKTSGGEVFFIDKTPPQVSQTFTDGGKNFATNEFLVPKITVSDYNLGSEKQTAEKVAVDINKIDMNGNTGNDFEATSSKYVPAEAKKPAFYEVTYNIFKDKEKSDGIYNISISVSDLAGNTVEFKDLNLSINRNGSTFELVNSEAREIVKNYETNGLPVQEAPDIEIREINVSKRVGDGVIMVTRDNKKSVILTGDDYTITEGKTGDNNGWYETIYRIDRNCFQDDGVYMISVDTSDEVGNENSNKKLTVQFSVDHTPPDIVISGVMDNANIKDSEVQLRFTFSDRNLYSIDSLHGDDMIIKINDDIYNFDELDKLNADISNDEAGNIIVLMNIKSDGKNSRNDISASLVDRADNISELKDSEITFRLSATFLVRNGWIAVIIGGLVLAVLLADIFFISKKIKSR